MLQWDIERQQTGTKQYMCKEKTRAGDARPFARRRLIAYRAVEHALAIHGNVEAALDPLDGHHSQTHRNKIEKGCGEMEEETVKRENKMALIQVAMRNRSITVSKNPFYPG